MSIVLPTINSFGADIAKEMSLGHQMQDDKFAEFQLRLSIPGREYTDTISYDIFSFCTGNEQNNSN